MSPAPETASQVLFVLGRYICMTGRFAPNKVYRCVWCSRRLIGNDPQLMSERLLSAEQCSLSKPQNLITVCRDCSIARDSRSVARWLRACQQAGMETRTNKILSQLRSLARHPQGAAARAELRLLGIETVALSGPLNSQPSLTPSVETIRQLIRRDGGVCVWCGCQLHWKSPQASREHLLPACRSRCNDRANLVLACRRCNNSRRDIPVAVWLKSCCDRGLQPRLDVLEQMLTTIADRIERQAVFLSKRSVDRQQLLTEAHTGLAAIRALRDPDRAGVCLL
jgi:hypothetical protein